MWLRRKAQEKLPKFDFDKVWHLLFILNFIGLYNIPHFQSDVQAQAPRKIVSPVHPCVPWADLWGENVTTGDQYLDLRKDTNFYPFARFLPLGRISCEGPGNGRFWTSVVNFVFRTFWADLPLLCAKYVDFSGRKFPGKGRKYPGKRRKYPARLNMTEQRKHEAVSLFLKLPFWFWNREI